jgi:general secretion pathway protein A
LQLTTFNLQLSQLSTYNFHLPNHHVIIQAMYRSFFGLKENPFNVTADPSFFFSSHHHQEAFSHLLFGIKERKGIIVITGEIGTGKTTLCRALLSRLERSIHTALILNPTFSEVQLLQMILKDLGVDPFHKNKFALVNALNDFLLEESNKGNNIALIIDEAQNLKPRQLEQIRLLSNLETEKQKLLQLILVGQPELTELLKLPVLRQLNQRVTVRYHIQPLEREEVIRYIQHRLKVAGLNPESNPQVHFSENAPERIFSYSAGTPRKINILCDRALLAAFAMETRTIDETIINRCIEEIGA